MTKRIFNPRAFSVGKTSFVKRHCSRTFDVKFDLEGVAGSQSFS